jgi:transcriptional regulator with XRE-family HTH domain
MKLGDKLPIYCEQRDWQLADLARAANVDVRTLYAMTVRHSHTSKFAPALAGALGISLEELLEPTPPRPRASPLRAEEPAASYGVTSLDELERQLVMLYRGCKPHRRDDLLHFANLWYVEAHPQGSAANPFPVVRSAPARKKGTR